MELQERPTDSLSTLHQNEETKKTLKEKIITAKNLITVEPILFSYLFSSALALGATQNMPFEMGCRTNLKLNDTICSDISVGIKYVAVLIGNVNQWTQPIVKAVPGILVLCFGSFSDRYKLRKPFFIIPVIGEVFSAIGLMFCAFFISQWPIEMFFVLAFILPAFFGSGQTILMAIYSYISDISTQEERTTRIGFVELVSIILTPIAPAVSGILFEKIGYYGVYTICLLLYLFAIIYGLTFIKEHNERETRNKNICIDVFNIKAVVIDMFKIIVRKRLAYKRMLLILSYVCYILIQGPFTGESTYIRIYALREFRWKVDIFGYYHAFDITIHILGMLLAVTIFTKKLQLNDLILASMACIFKIVSGIWYAFGTNVILFCLGPLISVFSGLYIIALRSLTTKLVEPTEIAKTQALFAICEALTPIIYSTIYFKFYKATEKIFHGAFYLLSSALVVLPLLILLGMYAVYKNSVDKLEIDTQKNENECEIESERL